MQVFKITDFINHRGKMNKFFRTEIAVIECKVQETRLSLKCAPYQFCFHQHYRKFTPI